MKITDEDDPHDSTDAAWDYIKADHCRVCNEHFETCQCGRDGDALGSMILTALMAIIVGLVVWALYAVLR